MKISTITILSLLSAVALLSSNFCASYALEDELSSRFYARILEVAKQEGIKNPEAALFDLCVKPICFSKAGEGVIHEDLYLSLDTKKNEIHTKHKSWEGLPATKSQTVFVVDGAVVEQLPADARWEQVTLVVFTPKVVQVY